MKDTKHIIHLDEEKMDRRHIGYLTKAILLGAFVTMLGYGGLFGLAVMLKMIFE